MSWESLDNCLKVQYQTKGAAQTTYELLIFVKDGSQDFTNFCLLNCEFYTKSERLIQYNILNSNVSPQVSHRV